MQIIKDDYNKIWVLEKHEDPKKFFYEIKKELLNSPYIYRKKGNSDFFYIKESNFGFSFKRDTWSVGNFYISWYIKSSSFKDYYKTSSHKFFTSQNINSEKWNRIGNFEKVFEIMDDETKKKVIYHIDLFV